jgi:hypothetical protein
MKEHLPITEELDFAYLLELMLPLYGVPEFAWLPELFSIIGHERLILLCKYAGGETIKIPTIEQLSNDIDALQWYYDVYIAHKKTVGEIPANLCALVMKIRTVYQN